MHVHKELEQEKNIVEKLKQVNEVCDYTFIYKN